MLPTMWKRKQQEKEEQNQINNAIKKISNLFLVNEIEKSNLTTLKTIFFISLIFDLKKYDLDKYYDTQVIKLRFDIDKMLKLTNLDRRTIRDNLDKLQDTKITFVENENIHSYVLIPRYHIQYNKNQVEVDIYVKIAKLILQVKNNYSFVNVRDILNLKHKHSIRMLGLLYYMNNFSKNVTKRQILTLNDLNAFFDTNYKTFGELERKVLKPIKEELDNNSTLTFVYEKNFMPKGRGRPRFNNITIDLINRKYYQRKLI